MNIFMKGAKAIYDLAKNVIYPLQSIYQRDGKEFVPKKLLIIICSKNPTEILIQNIINLYKIFNIYDLKICIIDSCSTDLTIYNQISKKFPLIEIHFPNNKNYEYGAYKYGYFKYPDYDIYCCIQDSFLINENIDISKINDKTALTYHTSSYISGFNAHPSIKPLAIELLRNVDLEYKKIINTNFTLATHSSFICTNYTIKNILETLINPPINKDGSCCYERLFGLYFIIKNYNTINISDKVNKIHNKRI